MSCKTIPEYIEEQNESGQRAVKEFVSFMEQNYPQMCEKICFSMPMWLKGSKMREGYLAISAAGQHFSIHFSDEGEILKLKQVLPECKTGKRCINIKYGDTEAFKTVKKYILENFS